MLHTLPIFGFLAAVIINVTLHD